MFNLGPLLGEFSALTCLFVCFCLDRFFVIENAAFNDPEPEVENLQLSKNICRSRLRNGSVTANIFLVLEKFLRGSLSSILVVVRLNYLSSEGL